MKTILMIMALVVAGLTLSACLGCSDSQSAAQSSPYFDKGQAPCFDASPRYVSGSYVKR